MADETKRVIDQATDTSLSAGDYVIVDSESEGTRKFDLGTELTSVKEDLANIYVQDGKLYIDGVAYELGGVGISNIAKTGTDGLVDTYTITMTDGTTYTFTVTNGDASDAKIQGFIDDWLDEHPEATTTVQDGAVTMAKLAPDVVAKFDDVNLTYKWTAVGYMRYHVRDFQGWAQCVVYDPDLDCAVGIINSGNGSHTNAQPWYRVTIDNSGYMSPYQEVKVYDTDGTTEITPTKGYMGTVQRLSDGTYMCIDINATIYTSTDKLVSLKKVQDYNFTSGTDKSMFSLTELSNGRLIIGHGGQVNGFWYSDNDGVSWTNVVPSASGLGHQPYPESGYNPFEPCFVECGNGKIIAYARKTMNAFISGPTNAYGRQEPAVYSVSTDYGSTWSAWANSSAITDMTANNGKIAIIDGVVHFVYGSRYDNTDADFKLYYTYAKLEDAYADTWATPIVIDVGQWNPATATNPHDSGYPSLWKDKNNNLFSVHYDGDGTGSPYGANWRLCTGAPIEKKPAVYDGGGGSCNVAYSQSMTDKLLTLQKGGLMELINDLYLKIGELPPQGDLDGSMYVINGLLASWDLTDISAWDGKFLKSVVNDFYVNSSDTPTLVEGANYLAKTSIYLKSTKANGSLGINGGDMLEAFGVSDAFTLEFVQYNSTSLSVWLDTSQLNGSQKMYQLYYSWIPLPNEAGTDFAIDNHGSIPNISGCQIGHLIYDGTTIKSYKNGTLINSVTPTASQKTNIYKMGFFFRNMNEGYPCAVRIYSKALTQEEIANNVTYAVNKYK